MFKMGELLLIVLIVFVIFGAGKLPNVLGDLGKGMKAFKDGMKDDEPTPPSASSVNKDNNLPPVA